MPKCPKHPGRGRPPKDCADCQAGGRIVKAVEKYDAREIKPNAESGGFPGDDPLDAPYLDAEDEYVSEVAATQARAQSDTHPLASDAAAALLAFLTNLDSDTKDAVIAVHTQPKLVGKRITAWCGTKDDKGRKLPGLAARLDPETRKRARDLIGEAYNLVAPTLRRLGCKDTNDFMTLAAVGGAAMLAVVGRDVATDEEYAVLTEAVRPYVPELA